MYSRLKFLVWANLRTPTPREISCTCLREISDNECYVVMASVDSPIVPPVSYYIRTNLIISGWRILKTDTGINLIWITQIDLTGCPINFLKSVQQQIPLCTGTVVKYIQENGYPATITVCTSDCTYENLDHSRRSYMAILKVAGQCS
jgi:hypothetical protein